MVYAVLIIGGGVVGALAGKTTALVPKDRVQELCAALGRVRVATPMPLGDVVVSDILGHRRGYRGHACDGRAAPARTIVSRGEARVNLLTIPIDKPEEMNFILGQSHFIKTVEDLHEALVNAVPNIKFGLAFCEASGPALVRASGTDPDLTELASRNALALGAGHAFIIFLGNAFPVNVLNAVKAVPEVCHVFCATANPTQVIVAESEQGRGILGVIDGVLSKGIETDEDAAKRKGFLRMIGYKLE